MYGVDVAATRADDLDKKMISYIKEQESSDDSCEMTVLDLGAGSGGQSKRMVDAGAQVVAVDVVAPAQMLKGVEFLHGDVRNLKGLTDGQVFDACCFQRTIHYLPYSDALQMLRELKQMVTGPLFISVTGLESDIGKNYADANLPVTDRFCALMPEAAETFSITEQVCLYTPEEFIGLLQEAGWEIEELWVSAFGNIKAVCM